MIDINFITTNTFYLILVLSAAPLLTSLIVGLLISVFQATTQIQDAALGFIPKIVLVFSVILLIMPWSIDILSTFTYSLFDIIAQYGSR